MCLCKDGLQTCRSISLSVLAYIIIVGHSYKASKGVLIHDIYTVKVRYTGKNERKEKQNKIAGGVSKALIAPLVL